MAQVAHSQSVPDQIDWALDYAHDRWSDIPDIAESWAEMDGVERLEFIYEWAIPQMWFNRLQEWAPLMSPEQRARYEELLALRERLQPTLDRLLAA